MHYFELWLLFDDSHRFEYRCRVKCSLMLLFRVELRVDLVLYDLNRLPIQVLLLEYDPLHLRVRDSNPLKLLLMNKDATIT